jgi:MarR family transcriptional regulator, organic hydroperoxide resistance regulator
MKYEQLKLSNQVCFPLYAASRLITREYQPYLDKMKITYPQYLVLLVLWETDKITVNEIAQKLVLNTNTITPLLKRMETQGLLSRKRSQNDERKVMICLTGKGEEMKTAAACIPEELGRKIITDKIGFTELTDLKDRLNALINYLVEKDQHEE